MQYTIEGVRVGSSSNGLGVFSLRTLEAHARIGPIQGEIVSDPQYGSDYCIDLGVESLEPAAPFRYLNHSCQPNCALVAYDEHGVTTSSSVWVEVLCHIAPEDEMTIDYAWPANEAIPCHCGSPMCRGWIVAVESLADVAPAPQDCPAAN